MMRMKLFIAGIVLVVAVAYLAVAGIRSGRVYYLEVDQFLADGQYHDQRVRLHGTVAEEGIDISRGALSARFILLGEAGQIGVAYHGVIPDLFQVGQQVVVEGRFDPSGIFKAEVLMTKCASKYEPSSPHGDAEQST